MDSGDAEEMREAEAAVDDFKDARRRDSAGEGSCWFVTGGEPLDTPSTWRKVDIRGGTFLLVGIRIRETCRSETAGAVRNQGDVVDNF